MKLLYKHQHNGVWFSKNGHRAFMRGEMPLFMWGVDKPGEDLEATTDHHIARAIGVGQYTRELRMFYRRSATPARGEGEG